MSILFLCNRKRCGNVCSYPICKHTKDTRFSIHYKGVNDPEKTQYKDPELFEAIKVKNEIDYWEK